MIFLLRADLFTCKTNTKSKTTWFINESNAVGVNVLINTKQEAYEKRLSKMEDK